MLNDLQIQVLDLLCRDARYSAKTIATMTGASEAEIAGITAQLEKEKIIVSYNAQVNWENTGAEHVRAVIEVKVTPQLDAGFDAIAAKIYHFDEVKSVFLMSGAYDLMLLVEAKTLRELAFFVAEKLSVLENVLSTATHFMLKTYKNEGVIFERDSADKRLLVSP